MARFPRFAVALSSAALAFNFQINPAQAQLSCPPTGTSPIATTTRQATLKPFSLQVVIPSNYRAMLFNDGSIHVVDPWTFTNFTCLANGLPAARAEYNTQEFRLVENPNGLTPADFAEIPIASEITASSRHSVNGIDVFIQRPDSPAAYHYVYAWLQLPESDKILRVSLEGSPEDLLELLNRCTFL